MSTYFFRKKICDFFSEEYARGAYISIFLIYCLYSMEVFLNYHAMVPDELWFLVAAKNIDLVDKSAAYLNYGAIYWFLLKLLTTSFVDRLFFLVLFLSIPLLLMASLNSARTKLLVLLLFLTFPFSFWSGKLIGAEIPVVFLVSASIFLLNKDKKGYASLLLGIASGIKIIAAPLIILLAINGIRINKYFKLFCVFLAGMWLANPFNLVNYIKTLLLTSTTQHSVISFERIGSALTENLWAWDNILVGSLSTFVMPPLLLIVLLLMSIYKIPKIALPCVIAIVGTGAIIVASPDAYGWYWFSIIPVVLYCTGMMLDSSIKNQPVYRIDFAIITITFFVFLANFFFTIGYTTLQIGQKAQQIELIKQFPENTLCLQNLIDKYQPKHIVDKLEFSDPSLFRSSLHAPKEATFVADISRDSTMILIGSRLLGNSFNFKSMLTEDDALYFYGSCGDFFVFTNSIGST